MRYIPRVWGLGFSGLRNYPSPRNSRKVNFPKYGCLVSLRAIVFNAFTVECVQVEPLGCEVPGFWLRFTVKGLAHA